MEPAAMDRIANRLSAVEGLYFPSSFLSSSPAAGPPSPPRRRAELRALLARDAPLFLERYGSALSAGELAAFDALSPDYEVDWHLRRLRAAAAGAPPPAAQVRNRRRAYLDRLVREGEYFSEEAMREREHYLHREYLGRFQDPLGRAMARPGERWSETLMRRAEEAVIVEKIRGEQIRRGVDPSEWESEFFFLHIITGGCKRAAAVDSNNGGGSAAGTFNQTLSSEEMQDQLERFTFVMQQKFLSGEDTEHMDYSHIDNDEMLDDHWSREANYDAE
ncbi:coiled-coil domain-containing protein 97 [Panicum miliaceum]|uniref:Coiled-coil domain-containing protein 97 n=1 Tax=Panicum miliaceum TaxID=4540 RepID=A0A3L6PDG8_PANMI|nr:coiled-coil domain-containing protein 97 [Panicum miliaceum]